MKKLILSLVAVTLTLISMSTFAARWVRASGGYVPRNAMVVGRDMGGQPLYLCRARIYGLQPGKVRPGIGGCNIPFSNRVIVARRYRVFVARRSFYR